MESTLPVLQRLAINRDTRAKTSNVIYWSVTTLFCLQMSFTAYAQLRLPQVADAFAHLGFPSYFPRGALLYPSSSASRCCWYPCRRASRGGRTTGFAIDLASALIAHLAVGDGFAAWSWAAGTLVLWGISYFFWRRLQV